MTVARITRTAKSFISLVLTSVSLSVSLSLLFGVEHLNKQCLFLDVATKMSVVEVLFSPKADKSYFWKANEQLTELVCDIGVSR